MQGVPDIGTGASVGDFSSSADSSTGLSVVCFTVVANDVASVVVVFKVDFGVVTLVVAAIRVVVVKLVVVVVGACSNPVQ